MPFASKIKINILNSIIVYKNQPETKQYYYAYINAAPCIRPRSEIQKKTLSEIRRVIPLGIRGAQLGVLQNPSNISAMWHRRA